MPNFHCHKMIKEKNLAAEKFCSLHHGQTESGKFSYKDARAFNCLSKCHMKAEACIVPCAMITAMAQSIKKAEAEDAHLL